MLNGQTGGVPINVLGPLTQFDEANAGLIAMAPGGGGHWCFDMTDGGDKTAAPVPPNFQGGGGSGPLPPGVAAEGPDVGEEGDLPAEDTPIDETKDLNYQIEF